MQEISAAQKIVKQLFPSYNERNEEGYLLKTKLSRFIEVAVIISKPPNTEMTANEFDKLIESLTEIRNNL